MGKRTGELSSPAHEDPEDNSSSTSASTQAPQRPTVGARRPTKQFVAHTKRNASTTRLNKLKGPEEFRRIKSTDNIHLRRNKSKTKMHTQLSALHKPQTTDHASEPAAAPPPASKLAVSNNGKGGILQLDHEDSDEDDLHDSDEVPRGQEKGVTEPTPATPLPTTATQPDEDSPKQDDSIKEQLVTPKESVPNEEVSTPQTTQKPPLTHSKSDFLSWEPSILSNSPAPKPQLTTETVVAVSDMSPSQDVFPHHRSASAGAHDGPYLDKSASTADLRSTITRTQQKLWLQRNLNPPHHPSSSMLFTTEQRKEFERVSKEYISIRNFFSPVVRSLERIQTRSQSSQSMIPKTRRANGHKFKTSSSAGSNLSGHGSPSESSLSHSLPKQVNSLSATTLKSPTTPKNTWHTASPTYTSNTTYLLNRMWAEGQSSDDLSSNNEAENTNTNGSQHASHHTSTNNNHNSNNSKTQLSSSPSFSGTAPSINSQAQLVNARIRQQAAA